jgi:hypothetical protein
MKNKLFAWLKNVWRAVKFFFTGKPEEVTIAPDPRETGEIIINDIIETQVKPNVVKAFTILKAKYMESHLEEPNVVFMTRELMNALKGPFLEAHPVNMKVDKFMGYNVVLIEGVEDAIPVGIGRAVFVDSVKEALELEASISADTKKKTQPEKKQRRKKNDTSKNRTSGSKAKRSG